MGEFSIPGGKESPQVVYHEKDRVLVIEGQSFPENAKEFYKPVLTWLQETVKSPGDEICLSLHLLYLNTSSIGVFLTIFRFLEESRTAGAKVQVEWLYDLDNEVGRQIGEDFQEVLDLPFTLKEVQ